MFASELGFPSARFGVGKTPKAIALARTRTGIFLWLRSDWRRRNETECEMRDLVERLREEAKMVGRNICNDTRDALLFEAADCIERSQWQPIATVPKEKDLFVDLWARSERITDCRYNFNRSRWEHWHLGDYDGMDWVTVQGEPTHWARALEAPK
jgi:hypothetical protein